MENNSKHKTVLFLTLPLAALIIVVSIVGLFVQGTYSKETPNWIAQAIGQDIIDLFIIAPLMLVTSFYSYKNNKAGLMLWSGTLLYTIYTFTIYSFDVHFNSMFVFYCLILGLSVYSFLYFLLTQYNTAFSNWFNNNLPLRTVGIYLTATAVLFYLLWLSQIIPALFNNSLPGDLAETGAFTNPVHVLDLSVCLPGLFLIGLFLIRKKNIGFLMAPAALLFCLLMDITIGVLALIMKLRELATNFVITYVMLALTIFTFILLIKFLKYFKPQSADQI